MSLLQDADFAARNKADIDFKDSRQSLIDNLYRHLKIDPINLDSIKRDNYNRPTYETEGLTLIWDGAFKRFEIVKINGYDYYPIIHFRDITYLGSHLSIINRWKRKFDKLKIKNESFWQKCLDFFGINR